MLRLLTL